jgi:hypothetical protein
MMIVATPLLCCIIYFNIIVIDAFLISAHTNRISLGKIRQSLAFTQYNPIQVPIGISVYSAVTNSLVAISTKDLMVKLKIGFDNFLNKNLSGFHIISMLIFQLIALILFDFSILNIFFHKKDVLNYVI